jgi:ribonuclease R
VNRGGNVTSYEILPTVIHSKRRYTYAEVQEILENTNDELIKNMNELREILRKKREKRGALDFDIPETKIRLDDQGRVISLEPHMRNNATGIIEEFMILCNETIATHFLAQKIPFVYRTHEAPSAEKIKGLQTIIQNLGIFGRAPKLNGSASLQKFLNTAAKTSAAYAVSTAVLQSLPQAHYTPDSPTHFGLASAAYCHFTSPIRRYADLKVHRIIKEGQKTDILHSICAQCSKTERTAEALEREVNDMKKVQFMADKEGQIFEGIISGIVPWGAFVMLENTVEGLIPTANLTRHRYKFNKEAACYEKTKRERGEKSPAALSHGSPVTVRLVQANLDERKLTFAIATPAYSR